VGPPPPPPPCGIVITKISPLTSADEVSRHVRKFGLLQVDEGFDFKLDPRTGMALGICFAKYKDDTFVDQTTGERQVPHGGQAGFVCAMEAIKRTNGCKIGRAAAQGGTEGIVAVELDADGSKAKAAAQQEIQRRLGAKAQAPRPSSSSSSSSSQSRPYKTAPDVPPASVSPTLPAAKPESTSWGAPPTRRNTHRSSATDPWPSVSRPDPASSSFAPFSTAYAASPVVSSGMTSVPSALRPSPAIQSSPNGIPSSQRDEPVASTSKLSADSSSPARSQQTSPPINVPLAPRAFVNGHRSPSSAWGKRPANPTNALASPAAAAKIKSQPQLKVQSPTKRPDDMNVDESDSGASSASDGEDVEGRAKREDRDKVFFPRKAPVADQPVSVADKEAADQELSERAILIAFQGAKARTAEESDAATKVNAQRQLSINGREHIKVARTAMPPALSGKPPMVVEGALRQHYATFRPTQVRGDAFVSRAPIYVGAMHRSSTMQSTGT
jgi:hypothetical protein